MTDKTVPIEQKLRSVVRTGLAAAGLKLSRLEDPRSLMGLERYKRLYSSESLEKRRFYNVGSGSFYHEYWTNLDYVSERYGSVQRQPLHIDLMQCGPLPIETGTAELVYTSHTVEHVSDAAVQKLCEEAFRVLKPGGAFRVTTGPDAVLDHAALMRGDADHFYWDENYATPGTYENNYRAPATSVPLEERWLHHVATQLAPNYIGDHPVKFSAGQITELLQQKPLNEVLDYLTGLCTFDPKHPENHMSWWSHDKMLGYLQRAGFQTAYRSAYGQSRFAVLRNTNFFDSTHPSMSLYVEAIKS